MGEGTALEAEFDTVASWTEEAVAELGPDHAIPAACRGSGSPADLRWLAEGLDLTARSRFLDAGSGLGGPAAWLGEDFGWAGRPVLAEPMRHAAEASRRLFGLPTVVAWAERLPFRNACTDSAWSLGVLCTTRSQRLLLDELRRVLVTGGRLSLLVLTATVDALPEVPEGNHFPRPGDLHRELRAAGFRVDDRTSAEALPGTPDDWRRRADRVDEVIRRDHHDHPDFDRAEAQQEVMGRLLGDGLLETTLLHTTAR